MEKIPAVSIECSNQCNLANTCQHCYGITGIADTPKSIQLNEKVIKILAKELPMITNSLTITGGEPTVYPKLVHRIVNETKLPWTLMTNGTIRRNDFSPKMVLVSLDGPDVRPGIDPKKVIGNALEYKCNLSINTVLSHGADLLGYYSLIKKTALALEKRGNYLSEWKLSFMIPRGYALKHPGIFADMDTIFLKLRKLIKIYFKEKPFPLALKGSFFTKNISEDEPPVSIDLSRNPCLDCFARTRVMCINALGELQLCSVARNKSIKIKSSVINACIEVLRLPELSKLTYRDWKECIDCKWFSICGAGCPGLAETYTGKWTGKDVLQCEIIEKTMQVLLPVFPAYMQDIYSVS